VKLSGFAIVVIVSVAVAACAPTAAPAARSASATPSLTIYGASSLKAALPKVKSAYESARPGTTVTISTDSSTALETKIEQGAAADVFLAADMTNPQKLVDKGLAEGSVTPFAGNALTVIVPIGNPAAIASPVDLAKPGVRVIAAADSVPVTKYAADLVANLAQQPGYDADFATRYAANVVTKEDNVAAVVSKIELGEGDAAIVYVTDARGSAKVKEIAVPPGANVSASYGAVVIKAANVQAGQTLLRWLTGRDGQAILGSFGFLPAGQ
jgi:molybdate transport system substrate-binding protein